MPHQSIDYTPPGSSGITHLSVVRRRMRDLCHSPMPRTAGSDLLQILVVLCLLIHCAQGQTQAYVAYMGSSMGAANGPLRSSHLEMLASTFGSVEVARKSLLYSYTHSINGFSAVLSKEQAQAIASMPGVISVFPSRMHKLHTTRSWDFLGLDADYVGGSPQFPMHPPAASDVIIGLLDTGVWPELASFNDDGMGPIPSRWRGKCVEGELFNSSNCNRKLIGARYYEKGATLSMNGGANFPIYNGPGEEMVSNEIPRSVPEYASARDSLGHGSHTATTAGGRAVAGASYYGLAKGTARGGAPHSRIASYKVCSEFGCSDADILAAFDNAIEDGVDILSISLGASPFLRPDLKRDGIAIGAFHAAQKGILVVCSAGNNGPYSYTVVNSAPWIFTVAASTVDRSFDSAVVLGNNQTFVGQALNYFRLDKPSYPLVFGGDIPARRDFTSSARRCTTGSLDPEKAKGKILLCIDTDRESESRKSKSLSVQSSGGVGMIIADDTNKFLPSAYVLPATQVSVKAGEEILDYIRSTSEAVATILPAETKLEFKPTPVVARFSSRGPNTVSENILKPDVAAPGVNILAGWTLAKPSGSPPQDQGPSSYAIISGTSMACPHVSGASALLKSIYPNWSIFAIKSALMTTATTRNNDNTPITNDSGNNASEFDVGSGEINPGKAWDPGLIYESGPQDHLLFLCYYGYNESDIAAISGEKSFICPEDSGPERISDLNYPSIAIAKLNGSTSVARTLTNVGAEDSIYNVTVIEPPGVEVQVSPQQLVFSKDQKSITVSLNFKVIESSTPLNANNYVFGRLLLYDNTHTVTTPIVVNPVST